ncbi:MAG: hypothetical protein QG670_596 [Thermoproteota archaeon]|nr:hypothetical protein [Thermoproteota archaeon]
MYLLPSHERGEKKLLTLYYFNWTGTSEELKEYIKMTASVFKDMEGISFRGVFIPTSEWNFALLYETKSFDKALEAFKTGMKKYGDKWQSKIPVSKSEVLLTFEELGY